MALKRKLTKTEFDALNPLLQAEYKLVGTDYVLDADDATALIAARDREAEAARKLREDNAALQAAKDEADRARAIKDGDVKTLEDSWKAKLAKEKLDNEASTQKLRDALQKQLVDGVAQKIATELAGENASVLVPHIKTRLKAEYDGDTPLTRVLDKDGKMSAASIEDLKKEFAGEKAFKPLIISSNATGGSADRGRNNGSADVSNVNKPFHEMGDAERTALHKTDPDRFKREVELEAVRTRKI